MAKHYKTIQVLNFAICTCTEEEKANALVHDIWCPAATYYKVVEDNTMDELEALLLPKKK